MASYIGIGWWQMRFRKIFGGWIVVGGIVLAGVTIVAVTRGYLLRKWDGMSRFTIVDIGDGDESRTVVESFDPVSRRGVKLILPDNMEIDTVGGRGKWRVKMLSQAPSWFGGKKWAADSVADYMGIMYTGEKTLLGWWDNLAWWRWRSRVDWREKDVADSSWVEEVVAADGERMWRLGLNWDVEARELFVSAAIVGEKLNVTVVNTTITSGLGGHAARSLESAGLRVGLVKSDEDAGGERCKIVAGGNTLDSIGAKRMVGNFGCGAEVGEFGEGEVELRLGINYQRWWLGI
ncbi:MAG TPA: hypothetical protein VJ327_08760 [Patescibacteria group bacterium]|nr:hypothetical protein [Patescibacteria group bacterium]